MSEKLQLFDTTLRDGAQTPGVSFTPDMKARIAERLDGFGFDYIEGGWPDSNPDDTEFFREIRGHIFKNAQLVAFGMTGRLGVKVENDPGLDKLLQSETGVITIFGKSWMLHVQEVLRGTEEQNLESIFGSVKYLSEQGREVFYDAEHFFDGYKANRDYALQTLEMAKSAGAKVVILCDTNGGSTPEDVYEATRDVKEKLGEDFPLGIHVHNDGGMAVSVTMAAVRAGVSQVQGTVNGLGERSGNVDWCAFLPTAKLKYGVEINAGISEVTHLARYVELESGLLIPKNAPYVGANAFKHKGGVHVDAVNKVPTAYEHIKPELVGQVTSFEHSDQGGGANVLLIAQKWGYKLEKSDPRVRLLVEEMKNLKSLGDAQEFLMLYRVMEEGLEPFELNDDETNVSTHRGYPRGMAHVSVSFAEAGSDDIPASFSDEGSFDAFAIGLKSLLRIRFPIVEGVQLLDYRVTTGQKQLKAGTGAEVEVYMELGSNGDRWTSIRRDVDEQVANQDALVDSYKYVILKRRLEARKRRQEAQLQP